MASQQQPKFIVFSDFDGEPPNLSRTYPDPADNPLGTITQQDSKLTRPPAGPLLYTLRIHPQLLDSFSFS